MNKRQYQIDFVEFRASSSDELSRATKFYEAAFGWSYQTWGDNYVDTQSSGVSSGINADPLHRPNNPLVVVFAADLEAARERVVTANGRITKEIFSFPGGRRFHFRDPAGNELAVWSEQL